jgi:LPXTG-motif cell wall-anchored protein
VTPPLANTGVSDPTPLLMAGVWLITGGTLLLYFARPKRVRVRRLVR